MTRSSSFSVRKLAFSGLFLALALVLPLVTGQIPQIGNMLLPMHLPVLLCGFICGPVWGLAVGAMAPLLRSVIFGMPVMFPVAVAMAFELATYALVVGLLYKKLPRTLPFLYLDLVVSMILGRCVWGAVRFALAGLNSSAFPFAAFWSGAITLAIPGIIAQLILVPLLVRVLEKAGLSLNRSGR